MAHRYFKPLLTSCPLTFPWLGSKSHGHVQHQWNRKCTLLGLRSEHLMSNPNCHSTSIQSRARVLRHAVKQVDGKKVIHKRYKCVHRKSKGIDQISRVEEEFLISYQG